MRKTSLSVLMVLCLTVGFAGFAKAVDVPPPVNPQWAGKEWIEPFPPVYTEDDARQDIDWLYSPKVNSQNSQNSQHEKVLWRVTKYMTQGTTVGHHKVSCQRCWNYYQATMRSEHPKWEQTR